MPSPTEHRPTSDALRALAEAGVIDLPTLERARVILGASPEASDWRRIIDRVLLGLGVLLLVAGVVAFFAYNWTGLAPIYKFALIAGGQAAALGVAWFRWGRPVGHAGLLAASVLVGVWLGVYGQVYPTGAPWYQFVGLWLLLILPWSLAARFAGQALFVVALLGACWAAFSTEALAQPQRSLPALGVGVLTAGALVVWEIWRKRGVAWLQPMWATRVLGASVLVALASPALDAIFDVFSAGAWQVVSIVTLGLALAGIGWFYQKRRTDLVLVAAALLTTVAVVASAIVRAFDASFWGFLVAALVVLAGSARGAAWLRKQAAHQIEREVAP